MNDIDYPDDERIPLEYRELHYWERGFEVAKRWYHEEWDGSYIQLDLARDIAEAILIETAKVVADFV
jgi:hypothetical protein